MIEWALGRNFAMETILMNRRDTMNLTWRGQNPRETGLAADSSAPEIFSASFVPLRLSKPPSTQRHEGRRVAEPQLQRSAGLQPALDMRTRKAGCKPALRPLWKIFSAREDLDVLQCRVAEPQLQGRPLLNAEGAKVLAEARRGNPFAPSTPTSASSALEPEASFYTEDERCAEHAHTWG